MTKTTKGMYRFCFRVLWAGITLGSAIACTSEDSAGTGDLEIAVSGGAAVRDGFPHTEGDVTYAFVDGWELQFSKYIISIAKVRLTEPDSNDEVASFDGATALDLKESPSGSVDLTVIENIPAVRQDMSFDVLAVDDTTDPGNVDDADFDAMRENAWSILAEGTASHTSQDTVQFRFGLPMSTHYYECINGKDTTQGIAVEANKTTGVYIYSHAIHMFWDTLATGDEDLRFDAFAAMRGDDDWVTEEELRGQDLNDLRDAEGNPLRDTTGAVIFYNDNGKLAPGEQDLYHFLLEASRASAHFNGVGLCRQRSLDG